MTIDMCEFVDARIDLALSSFTGGGGSSYSDEQAQDAAAAMILAGTHTGISFTYNDALNKLSATVSSTSITVTDTATIDLTLTGNNLSAIVIDASITYAKIQNIAASRLLGNPTGGAAATSEISLGAGLSFSGTTLISTITQYTDEAAQDAVGNALVDSATVDFTYNDAANTITAITRQQMSITSDALGLKLTNDQASPGNNQFYRTTSSGVKGWAASLPGELLASIDSPSLGSNTWTTSVYKDLFVTGVASPDTVTLNYVGDVWIFAFATYQCAETTTLGALAISFNGGAAQLSVQGWNPIPGSYGSLCGARKFTLSGATTIKLMYLLQQKAGFASLTGYFANRGILVFKA